MSDGFWSLARLCRRHSDVLGCATDWSVVVNEQEKRVVEAAVDYYNHPCTITDHGLLNAVRAYLNGAMPEHARYY